VQQKSNPLGYFAVISADAWNFSAKIYQYI